MNKIEQKMVDILKDLKENFGAISVRAEFEAEGTKLEELLRLKEISMTAGLGLTLKIGGCESIRDMLEAHTVGVNYIVAPMVESPYALRKYLQAIEKIFPTDELKNIEVLCNIETKIACENLHKMIEIPEIKFLKGIVIERVDLCFSIGKSEKDINDDDINEIVLNTIKKAKDGGLSCTVGGGVSAHSLAFFKSIPNGFLDRYETRKVCFSFPEAIKSDPEKGILKALGFELLWLKNKTGYLKGIYESDTARMELIERRYLREIDALI